MYLIRVVVCLCFVCVGLPFWFSLSCAVGGGVLAVVDVVLLEICCWVAIWLVVLGLFVSWVFLGLVFVRFV